jgi:hypothetical protein
LTELSIGIVITDLEDSDSDVEQLDADPEILISPAVLSHIKSNTTRALSTQRPEMALVLYKPIKAFGRETECDQPRMGDRVQSDDDAMDVGP